MQGGCAVGHVCIICFIPARAKKSRGGGGLNRMVGNGSQDCGGGCGVKWAALAAQAAMMVVLAAGFGCAEPEPPTEPSESVEVLDLVAGFTSATVSRVETTLGGGPPGPKPFVNPERGVLFVPLGASVEYEFDLPPGGVLRSGDARNVGSATGRLEVAWVPTNGAEVLITRDLSAAPARLACFGNTELESGRLVIRGRGQAIDDDPRAGMRVFNPKVIAGVPCVTRRAVDQPRAEGRKPNIVVYLIDALRADRVSCYGYRRATTPHIDEFASSSLVFTGAQAQTSWTRPAVASVFTGLLPQQHRAIDKKDALPESATTLAELLSGAGYESSAVISNGNVSQIYGFSQGFSYFKYLQEVEIGEHVVRSEDVNDAVFSWLDEARGEDPFFLYIHTVDPHLPYAPPANTRRVFAPEVSDHSIGSVEAVNKVAADRHLVTPALIEQLNDLYDGEVAANDASFGELMAGLTERGLVENTVIVVLSDHGEEFFDHQGWTHGNTLHAEMLDVPLIIRIPEVAPKSIPEIVQHVDVFSTLIDLAGLEAQSGVFGRTVRPLWTLGSTTEWTDRGVSHLQIKERFGEAWADSRWKMLTRRLGNGEIRTSLFDRIEDPLEQIDLAEQRPDLVEALRALYQEDVAAAGESLVGAEVDAEREAEVEAQLRALGYL